jgi:prepilin-type N-terminal cleavage/methylation domain-containing protein
MRKKLETPIGHDCRDMSALKSARKDDRGFSLIELCVVMAILMIVAGMVFINAASAMRGIRLQQSAVSYANLLQQARIRAVTDDNFYTVQTALLGSAPIAYVDIDNSGTYTAPEPMMAFSQDVSYMAFSSGPNKANLESKFLPVGQEGTVSATSTAPTFGPRGLPCRPGGSICPYINGGVATSYITFLQNAQSAKWEAVTVSPAGRIKIWSYNDSDSTWSTMN